MSDQRDCARANGHEAAGPDGERDVTDPEFGPDPARWQTEVVEPPAPRR
jgi:hypothetical protein